MTVQEITEKYNDIIVKLYKVKPKSDKTIYRYLKALIDKGLVVHAGQRIEEGKKVSEKLYMRTARAFEQKDIEWMSEKGEAWARQFGLFIGQMLNTERTPSITCIKKFFQRWGEAKIVSLEKLATEAPDDLMRDVMAKNWKDWVEFMDRVYLFGTLLNHPELLEELRQCFQ